METPMARAWGAVFAWGTPLPSQTAQGKEEHGGTSNAQMPQAHHTSEHAGEDGAAACCGVDVQHHVCRHRGCSWCATVL